MKDFTLQIFLLLSLLFAVSYCVFYPFKRCNFFHWSILFSIRHTRLPPLDRVRTASQRKRGGLVTFFMSSHT